MRHEVGPGVHFRTHIGGKRRS